ncbi:MAG: DNA recombination protein RmuC [Christensenellales bacterium]
MELWLIISAGVCIALQIVILALVMKRNNQSANAGASLERLEATLFRLLSDMKKQSVDSAYQQRREVIEMFGALGDGLTRTLQDAARTSGESMDKLREMVEARLKDISDTTEKRLEQMRKTVDEQLSDMLQKRLTGSFRQVSDQLEQVFKSMGEVRTLAADVGDLKRVLSNVKVRGIWGETQLGALISEMLSPAQYVCNAAVKDGRERVEFAVAMPGTGGGTVLLPIDSKFPMEAYIRKEELMESGDTETAREALKDLSRALITEAKRIHDKYINPPVTTDFAIMYLPTEGLYADAISMGVFDVCQREYHVTIAGPSTLTALLNSLQMGFRTLAIERQSGEVLRLLETVRKSFSAFTSAIERTQRSLQAAQNNLDDASRKSRHIEKELMRVESAGTEALLERAAPAGEALTSG